MSFLAALLLATSLSAQPPPPESGAKAPIARPDETPWFLRLIIRPMKRGMLVNLPIIDTDPNRGTTGGFMPIFIIQEAGSDRIRHIHAPSVTYNKTFKTVGTYRYYYYPTDASALVFRGALSQVHENELMAKYDDGHFMGSDGIVSAKLQWNTDGSMRFFGIGPDTSKDAESNYTQRYTLVHVSAGAPVRPGSSWKIHAENRFSADSIQNGRTPNLKPFSSNFPDVAPRHYQQSNQIGAYLDYDTRDHDVTTSQGTYMAFAMNSSIRGLASAYDFQRYEVDLRHFDKVGNHVMAVQFRYEQITNTAPFWLMPYVGGKYSLRSYGDGRYTDRGAMTYNVEHRYTLWRIPLAGVVTEFELGPFVGVGTVFDTPGKLQRRLMRPVFGIAGRAVARPQVVGSLDFGVGQEGLKAFIDINYSF